MANLPEWFVSEIFSDTRKGQKPRSPFLNGNFPAGVQIHKNNIYWALNSTLRKIYPTIYKLVGEDCFDQLVFFYSRIYKPETPVLTFYGEKFPQFLLENQSTKGLEYLPDVARFEWALHESFHSPNLSPQNFGKFKPEWKNKNLEIAFSIHPSVRIISSPFPIRRIWKTNLPGRETGEKINLKDGRDYLLITRPEFEVFVYSITLDQYRFLEKLLARKSLREAGECLKTHLIRHNSLVEILIKFFCELGVFATLTLREVPERGQKNKTK